MMQELEPTWGRVARIWWAFTWRSVIIGWGLLIVVYVPFRFIGPNVASEWFVQLGGLILGTGIQVGAQVWALRQAVSVDFNDFRVTLSETFLGARVREAEEGSAAV